MSARKSCASGNSKIFAKGAVTRVWARNFLTFTEFEMRPEPNLNLIIGPNGTGKSSLVNALVLGLAGKPAMLGRATSIADYIQYGKDKAELQIDLYNENGAEWKIYREIKRTGGSSWTINGKPATLKSVEELMAQLKIQVGNLCQFLPQDKVADFAKMNPIDLFQNTQKAAGSEKLYSQHQDLIQKRSEAQKFEKDINAAQANVKQEMVHHDRIKELMKHNDQRESHLAKVKLLKEKYAWLEYSYGRDQYVENKRKLEQMVKDLTELKKKTAPQENALMNAKKIVQTSQLRLAGIAQPGSVSQRTQAMKVNFDKITESITEVKSELQFLKNEENRRIKRIETLDLQIRAHEEDLRTCIEDDQSNKEDLQAVDSRILTLSEDISSLQANFETLRASREADTRQLSALEAELRRLKDVGGQREQILKNLNPHTYAGLLWMRQNQNLFKKHAYEPLMLNIHLLDVNCAKYIEAHIPLKDLLAFAFEDKEDRELFMREVRDKKNLRVNSVDIPNVPLANFNPREPIEKLKKWGFQVFLKDVFQAPEGVMQYLCKQYNVHSIPIGNDVTERNLSKVVEEANLPRFYTSTRTVSVKVSKYSKQKVSLNSFLRGARFLSESVDQTRIDKLQENIRERESVIHACSDNLETNMSDQRSKLKEREDLRMKKKKLLEVVKYAKTLELRIRKEKEDREMLSQKEFNVEEEEQKSEEKIKKLILEKASLLQEYGNSLKLLQSLIQKRVLAAAKVTVALKNVTAAEKKLKEDRENLKEFVMAIENFSNDIKILKRKTRDLLNAAKKMSDLQPDEVLSDKKKQAFDKLPNELEDVQSMIFDEQTRADLLCAVDPSVIEEFQTRKASIDRLDDEISRKDEKLSELKQKIKVLEGDWLPAVEDLIQRINVNFSKFFCRLKCVGEIVIDKSSNEMDYHNWGVKIRVKFRDTEPLKELSSMNHSGGEQSVATALYMLALQELTHVPFRCVDEINQGMDTRNERKVFDFITETACQKKNAQYFLLTPKLLPNLEYSRNMKVFIIHNGQHFRCAENWDLSKFIHRANDLSD